MSKTLVLYGVDVRHSVVLDKRRLLPRKLPCPKAVPRRPSQPGIFPDRVHEFVWRNWNVVEPAKLAKILGTSVEDITAMAESMGLPPAADDSPRDEDARLHHPHPPQLAPLALRPIAGAAGDDARATGLRVARGRFPVVKLGQLKPKCEPLRYHPPDEAARRRAAEIKRRGRGGFRRRRSAVRPSRVSISCEQLSKPLAPRVNAPPKAWTSEAARLAAVHLFLFRRVRRSAVESRVGSLSRRIVAAAFGLGDQRRLAARRSARLGARAERRFPSSAPATSGVWPIFGLWWSGRRNTASACIST